MKLIGVKCMLNKHFYDKYISNPLVGSSEAMKLLNTLKCAIDAYFNRSIDGIDISMYRASLNSQYCAIDIWNKDKSSSIIISFGCNTNVPIEEDIASDLHIGCVEIDMLDGVDMFYFILQFIEKYNPKSILCNGECIALKFN